MAIANPTATKTTTVAQRDRRHSRRVLRSAETVNWEPNWINFSFNTAYVAAISEAKYT
jgi:hypothetical protein